MKELIINADDFGLSEGTNRAIVRAYREGILTSASLMVGGKAFDEAVSIAREIPGLQVGLHLTLVQGRSVLPPEEIPALVNGEGNFTDDPVNAGMRYFFVRSLKSQLYREMEAQIRAFRKTGISLSHIDGHLNIHMHPVVFDILLDLMPKYGISSFRLTRENLLSNLAVDRERILGKMADAFIFSCLARRCRAGLEKLGITYVAEVKGLLNSGRMTEQYLLRALVGLTAGTTEIYFHPGCHPCGEIRRLMPDYLHEQELSALTSPRVREKLVELGIRLRNYRGEEKSYA
jgi:hopanoid biosynthesis associated protein HpnK